MVIRHFQETDYQQVVELLISQGVEPPEHISELAGLCFVAVEDNNVIGVIYALTGASSKAYVDYLAISNEYHGTTVFFKLLSRLEDELKALGVTKYIFHIEKNNSNMFKQLYRYRVKYDITKLRDLHYFSRVIG